MKHADKWDQTLHYISSAGMVGHVIALRAELAFSSMGSISGVN
jgi:hypothetical protein